MTTSLRRSRLQGLLPILALLASTALLSSCEDLSVPATPTPGVRANRAPQAATSSPEERAAAVVAWREPRVLGDVVDVSVGRWFSALQFRKELENVRCVVGATLLLATSSPIDYGYFLNLIPDTLRPCQYEGHKVACGAFGCSSQRLHVEGLQENGQDPFFGLEGHHWMVWWRQIANQTRARDELSPELHAWHVGWFNGCGLDDDGRPWCQLLGPDTAPVAQETFVELATASPDLACGLRADGTVRCWGAEAEQGPLAEIPGTYIEQCVAPFHWCGLTATGEVHCRGEDLFGETRIPEGPVYGALGCDQEVTCVAEVAGEVRCFGRWSGDALVPPAGLAAWRVRVGPRSACALTHDGGVTCWGDGAFRRDPAGNYTPAVNSQQPIEHWDGHHDAGADWSLLEY